MLRVSRKHIGGRSTVYRLLGRFPDALQDFKRIKYVDSHVEEEKAMLELRYAQHLITDGNPTKALEYVNDAIDKGYKTTEHYVTRGGKRWFCP